MSALPRSRYDWTRPELGELLAGQPRYRVDQVWQGLHDHGTDPTEWSNLPKALRAELAEALPPALELTAESVSDDGQTVKWLWTLADGHQVETVLMRYPERATVCVSRSSTRCRSRNGRAPSCSLRWSSAARTATCRPSRPGRKPS